MNEMRKLMEAVEGLAGIAEVHGDAYVAATLYLNYQGRTKPQLAKKLSDVTGMDINAAIQMIDAIDAYEDIKDAEEFKHVSEDILDEEGWRHERERLKVDNDFRMRRPQLSIPPTQEELEQAFQRFSSMCTAYETMIEMKEERIKELEAELEYSAGSST